MAHINKLQQTRSDKMTNILCPTKNGRVRYVTSVQPHPIQKDPQLVDPYVRETLEYMIGIDPVALFLDSTRSYYTLEGHYENLWKFDTPHIPRPTNRRYQEALYNTQRHFRLPKPAVSHSWDDLKSVPFVPTSGAGYGYVGKRGDPGNHDLAINRAVGSLYAWDDYRNRRTRTRFLYRPYLAWTRTQLATFDAPKIRHVWGAAFENIILEGINAYPLIKAYQEWTESPMVIGIHTYKRLPHILHSVLAPDADEQVLGIGLDISGFDQSVQPWFIQDAFNILRQNITFSDPYAAMAWEYALHHFIHKVVVMPDGRMWHVSSGVPSGSYFTQIIDSVVNHILVSYIQITLLKRPLKTYVLGDDSLFGLPLRTHTPYPVLEQMAEVALELGMTLSIKKSVITNNLSELEFLGHSARGLKIDRDFVKLLRLTIFPEFPVSDVALSISRIEGILIDSALQHWPIIHLHELMIARYGHHTIKTHTSDTLWRTIITQGEYTLTDRKETDLTLKIWTLT
nr:RNA-dependent RNA polymerase [Mute swan feces associated partitiviridae J]